MDKLDLKATIETGSIVEGERALLDTYSVMLVPVTLTVALGIFVYVNEFKFYAGTTKRALTSILFILSVIITLYTFFKVRINSKLVTIPIRIPREDARLKLITIAQERN